MRLTETALDSEQRGWERFAFPKAGKNGAGRPNVQFANNAGSGSGTVQDAATSSGNVSGGPLANNNLSGVINLLESDSDRRGGNGAVVTSGGEAPDSNEIPMLEYTNSYLQQIDEHVSESQGP